MFDQKAPAHTHFVCVGGGAGVRVIVRTIHKYPSNVAGVKSSPACPPAAFLSDLRPEEAGEGLPDLQLTVMLSEYHLHMICNQVLEDSPSDVVWNCCFLCPAVVTAWGLQPPPPSRSRKVGQSRSGSGNEGSNQLAIPSPKRGVGLSCSPLIATPTAPGAFTVVMTGPRLPSQQPHGVDHYNMHFTYELAELLRGHVPAQGTQPRLGHTSV